MQARLKNVSSCEKELQVELPREVVQAEFEQVFKKLQQVAEIPGYRKGHAPRDLVEQHHGEKAHKEVVRSLVGRSLDEALKQHADLNLVTQPQVDQVKLKLNEPMTFVAKLEVAPEIQPGRYKGLKLNREKAEVSPEKLQEILVQIQESQATLKPILEVRPAQEGDFLLADITDRPQGKAPTQQKDQVIALDLKRDPENFLKSLLGMKPGEKREVPNKRTEGTVLVELKEIKTKSLPELNDELAKGLGKFESLAALKAQVQKDLEVQAANGQRHALENQTGEQLLEQWKFDVPPSLVGHHAKRLIQERASALMQKGIPQVEVEKQAKALADQAKLDALKQVKLFYCLHRIAELEELRATEEEISQRVKQLAEQMKIPEDQVRSDLKSRNLQEDMAWGITREKVLNFIIQEAKIKEV